MSESENPGEGQPPSKKLRHSDPDLKIVLKYTDENGDNQQKEVWQYSQVLATLSEFVDAALSTDMAEKGNMTITFDDTTPELFEQAISCLQDPLVAKQVSPEMAFQLAVFYDKYQFPRGIAFCDQELSKYIERNALSSDHKIQPEITTTKTLDFLVDVVSMGEKLNFEATSASANLFLDRIIAPIDSEGFMLVIESYNFSIALLSLEHLEKLRPLLKTRIMSRDIALKMPRLKDLTEAEIDSSLFPMLLQEHFYAKTGPCTLRLSGTETSADGNYIMRRRWENFQPLKKKVREMSGDEEVKDPYFEEVSTDIGRDWVISGRVAMGDGTDDRCPLWTCKNSGGYRFPPFGPWTAIHEVAAGTCPTVSYIFKNPFPS